MIDFSDCFTHLGKEIRKNLHTTLSHQQILEILAQSLGFRKYSYFLNFTKTTPNHALEFTVNLSALNKSIPKSSAPSQNSIFEVLNDIIYKPPFLYEKKIIMGAIPLERFLVHGITSPKRTALNKGIAFPGIDVLYLRMSTVIPELLSDTKNCTHYSHYIFLTNIVLKEAPLTQQLAVIQKFFATIQFHRPKANFYLYAWLMDNLAPLLIEQGLFVEVIVKGTTYLFWTGNDTFNKREICKNRVRRDKAYSNVS